jgi:dienelactone hydrolase
MTPTDQKFLAGEKGDREAVIGGTLVLPRTGNERLPAVILLHGSGGVGGYVDLWARELNDAGIATFVLDSFTGRGIANIMTDQARLGRLTMIYDSYRALERLASHPNIDPSKIVLMGFSRGGQAALYASLKRFHRAHLRSDARFAAYVVFYSACNLKLDEDENVGAPIRLYHGLADNYVPIGPCREYVARLRRAGKDARLIEYPDAEHNFDNPLRKTRTFFDQAQTTRKCFFEERGGLIVNVQTGKPFTYEDACVERGASVAYNEKAHRESVEAVKAFLRETFESR